MVPDVRIRQEDFGFILAFGTGEIGLYNHAVAGALLHGTTREALEPYRLPSVPVRDEFHLSAPLIVWFEITRACNLTCRHCYIEAGKPREQELSTPEIFDALEQMKAAGVFALVLVGGEPMMHPDFLAIVNHAHQLGFVISIATNGAYITQDLIDRLPRKECVVSVSVDGTAKHKELRIRSTWDDVRERILLLRRNGIPTAIMSTQTAGNVHELQTLLDFAREHQCFFGSTPMSPIGRGRFFPQYQPQTDIVEETARLYIADKLHDQVMNDTVGLCVAKFLDECHNIAKATGREFCGVAMAYLMSDGSLYPCSICASNDKFRAGSLREHTFQELWRDSFKDIRQFTYDKFKECPNCELSRDPYYCTSRCAVMAERYTGDPLGCGSTPFVKASLKRRTELLQTEFPGAPGST
ncbi:radical SAM/SPASM domain-containing protein [Duganella sp. HH101]|uniref:radical SAM/SPASM domain-containing protein n=1 Tax=Duganella sp. HH101 TaxID=1781066 RepID=UPI0008739755|nr:radical SAM protein [Duganella sp. HH101]OEZ98921.1 antilisterial bacteriocin subtilosin biosynthesis protein AlbA [Duganella sp. HH101]